MRKLDCNSEMVKLAAEASSRIHLDSRPILRAIYFYRIHLDSAFTTGLFYRQLTVATEKIREILPSEQQVPSRYTIPASSEYVTGFVHLLHDVR
jgi:hypothetical protein